MTGPSIQRLGTSHQIEHFRCGVDALDTWLRNHAARADRAGTARTFIWASASGEVRGYFALAPHLARRVDLPPGVGRGSPDLVPAILIARLAVAEEHQGSGEGGRLLVHAVGAALDAIRLVGGRIVIVDAIDDRAAAFYRHHGFRPLAADPRRLVTKASSAARSLARPWP